MIPDRTTQPALDATKGCPDAPGANVPPFSENATLGQLCLYSADGDREMARDAGRHLVRLCAGELRGELVLDPAVFGHAGDDLTRDDRDRGLIVPKTVVVDADFDWDADDALRHRWGELLSWEAHAKGAALRRSPGPKITGSGAVKTHAILSCAISSRAYNSAGLAIGCCLAGGCGPDGGTGRGSGRCVFNQ